MLLRVVAGVQDDVLVVLPDPRARRGGRGAWVHLDPRCLDLAERRRAFARALRQQGALDCSAVREHLHEHHTTVDEQPEAGHHLMGTR